MKKLTVTLLSVVSSMMVASTSFAVIDMPQVVVVPTPEPATVVLVGLGVLGLLGLARKRSR